MFNIFQYVNTMFVQSYLVFNNGLKTLAQNIIYLYFFRLTFFFQNILIGHSTCFFLFCLLIVSESSETTGKF